MKRVILYHAHHADEGVYRIVVATATQTVTHVHVPNPLHDPSAKLLADGDPNYVAPEMNGHMNGHNGHHHGGYTIEGSSPAPEERLMLVDATILEPTIVEIRNETVLSNPIEVVWAADDERWEGRELDDIAAEQRQILRDHLADQERLEREAEAREAASTHDMGSAGEEL